MRSIAEFRKKEIHVVETYYQTSCSVAGIRIKETCFKAVINKCASYKRLVHIKGGVSLSE